MPEARSAPLLAFDYGRRRIGVALGIPLTHTAAPLTTLTCATLDEPPWPAIDALLAEWRPGRLLVGLPEARPGSEALRAAIRAFAATLAERYTLPVEFVDERLSSREASERLRQQRQAGRRRRVRKAEIDAQAAAILVESWLMHRTPTP